jgi:hypothetical protein
VVKTPKENEMRDQRRLVEIIKQHRQDTESPASCAARLIQAVGHTRALNTAKAMQNGLKVPLRDKVKYAEVQKLLERVIDQATVLYSGVSPL